MRKVLLLTALLFAANLFLAQTNEEWQNSGHANLPWTGSFAQGANSQNNSLSNCIRCHDGNGFVNFTMGMTTQTDTLTQAGLRLIDCSTCHNPDASFALRLTPEGSDTLANGYSYNALNTGAGNLCMNCHKGRRNTDTYALGPVNSEHWGPHYSVQTDVLLGQNAAKFDGEYSTADPQTHLTFSVNGDGNGENDACVDCHRQPTPGEGEPGHNMVGGHTFKLSDTTGGTQVDLVTICANCHVGVTSWEELKPGSFNQDYDGNGTAESIQLEVKGLLDQLKMALPPVGEDSIDWTAIQTAADTNMSKAYYNWQMFDHDGSFGIHNPQYAVSALQASLQNVTVGVEQKDNLIPTEFALDQNYPNPFNPATTIQFSLPEPANITLQVYDITGKIIATLYQGDIAGGTFTANWIATKEASGIYFYRISSDKFNMTKKMILMK